MSTKTAPKESALAEGKSRRRSKGRRRGEQENGLKNGQKTAQKTGQKNGPKNGHKNGQVDAQKNGHKNGQKNGHKNGQVDAQKNGQKTAEANGTTIRRNRYDWYQGYEKYDRYGRFNQGGGKNSAEGLDIPSLLSYDHSADPEGYARANEVSRKSNGQQSRASQQPRERLEQTERYRKYLSTLHSRAALTDGDRSLVHRFQCDIFKFCVGRDSCEDCQRAEQLLALRQNCETYLHFATNRSYMYDDYTEEEWIRQPYVATFSPKSSFLYCCSCQVLLMPFSRQQIFSRRGLTMNSYLSSTYPCSESKEIAYCKRCYEFLLKVVRQNEAEKEGERAHEELENQVFRQKLIQLNQKMWRPFYYSWVDGDGNYDDGLFLIGKEVFTEPFKLVFYIVRWIRNRSLIYLHFQPMILINLEYVNECLVKFLKENVSSNKVNDVFIHKVKLVQNSYICAKMLIEFLIRYISMFIQ